jgi:hypothetical protein
LASDYGFGYLVFGRINHKLGASSYVQLSFSRQIDCEAIIRFQHTSCIESFVASIDGCEGQAERVDIAAATEAETLGWISAPTDQVFYPKHPDGGEVALSPSLKGAPSGVS